MTDCIMFHAMNAYDAMNSQKYYVPTDIVDDFLESGETLDGLKAEFRTPTKDNMLSLRILDLFQKLATDPRVHCQRECAPSMSGRPIEGLPDGIRVVDYVARVYYDFRA